MNPVFNKQPAEVLCITVKHEERASWHRHVGATLWQSERSWSFDDTEQLWYSLQHVPTQGCPCGIIAKRLQYLQWDNRNVPASHRRLLERPNF